MLKQINMEAGAKINTNRPDEEKNLRIVGRIYKFMILALKICLKKDCI